MKKKMMFILILGIICFSITGCSGREKLMLLNWGEYINEDMVEAFEKEYNCDVIISLGDSNEIFYQKIKSGTTAYDLCIPSDYMAQRMYEKNLLQAIDLGKLENYDEERFMPGLNLIRNSTQIFKQNKEYMMPYFWGTFGIMYNKKVAGLEEAIHENGWKAIFEENATPTGTKVGMYDVSRYAFAASMFYAMQLQNEGIYDASHKFSPNEATEENLRISEQILKQRKFKEWGTDMLKKNISSGNLDVAYLWTGDFFDVLYELMGEGVALEDMEIGLYVPDLTIGYVDAMVIPKNARNADLAHKFIDFFMRPEVAFENASIVGYCTPYVDSYAMIEESGDDLMEGWWEAITTYSDYKPEDKGMPLLDLQFDFLKKLNTMIENIKASR